MTIFSERTNTTILSMAGDADGDPLSVLKVNGQEALVGVPIPLSVGGSVTVTSEGVVTFDDTGFTIPDIGDYVADGLIVTITDGTAETETSVNLELYGALSADVAVFGALTRPFEGGVPAPDGATSILSGDPNGHFAISGGMILPTLAGSGVMSGTYVLNMDNGSSQEITILPGVFSISKDTELSSLLSDADQPYDGHTIQLRPGQYDHHTLPAVTFTSGGVTITADGPGTQMRRLFLDHCWGNPEIVIKGITFTSDTVETDSVNRIFYARNSTPNGIFRIEDCRFEGHPGINADPSIWYAKLDYTGATAVPVAGERIDNDGGGDAGAYTTILEVHDNGDGTGTLYVDDNPGQTNGGSADNQGVAWAVGQVITSDGGWSATLSTELYGGDDTLGNGIEGGHAFDEMYVERCVFVRLAQAMEVAATTDVVVRDSAASDLRADFVKVHCPTGVPPTNQTLIERNLLSRGMVGGSDYGNPHRDGIQLSATQLTQNWPNMTVRNNVFWTGASERTLAKSNNLQSFFLPTKNSSGFGLEGAQIHNNVADCGGGGNALIMSYAYSCVIENNTCVSTLLRNSVDHKGAVKLLVATSYGDDLSVIKRNVTETLSAGSNDISDNTTESKYFDFSAHFPAWTGVQDFTDVTTLFTTLTPGAGTPVMAGSTWDRLTDHGCVNEAGRFIGHDGTDLTDHFLNLELLRDGGIAQFQMQDTPGAFASEDWTLSDAGTGGAVEVTVLALPSNGSASILDIQASIDGGSFVSIGAAQPGSYILDGLSNDTEVSVTLRAVNGIGAGPESPAQTTTPTQSMTVPVQFGASDWSVADDASGGAVTVTLNALPDDGGSALTAVEYSIDGGAFSDLGLTAPGNAVISGLSDDVSIDLVLRAVNAVGAGIESAAKSVTPTAGEQPLDESFSAEDPAFERVVYDTDRLNGGLTADVPVYVNQPALANTALEGRAIDAAGNATAWVSLGTADGSGVLSSTLLGIPRALEWYKWQIRKAATPSEGGTTAGEFGVGDVLAFFGQSPIDQSFLFDASPRALSGAEVLTLVTGNGTDVEHLPIMGSYRHNDSMAYLNDMIAATSDAVCMVVDLARSGTSRRWWADDSPTSPEIDRDWSEDQLRVDHVRNAGTDISLIYETWHTSDSGELASDAIGAFLPFYTGMDSAGNTVAYGSTVTASNGTSYVLNKSLFDVSGADRGMFDTARTKMVMATPYGNAFEGSRNYLTQTDGTVGTNNRIRFNIRDKMELLNADPRMAQVIAQVGPYSYNVHTDGSIHLDNTLEFGRPHIVRNGLAAMYLANGVIADDYSATLEGTPEITDVTWTSTHADVQVSVPPGRNLTTTALARGLGPLGTSKPHFAEVMGFEVAQTELHDLLPSGYTAVIHDAAAGIIRITPDIGSFEPGARIAYARGASVPVFDATDRADGTHFYVPIVTSGAGGGYDGMPLRPNVEFVCTDIAGTLRAPRVITQPDLGFSIAQTGSIGAGRGGQLTIEFIGSLAYTHQTIDLITMNANNLDLTVSRDGEIRFRVKGNTGTTVFDETSAQGIVQFGWSEASGQVLHLVASVDLAGQEAHVWVKDDTGSFNEVLTPSFTTTETEFVTSRRFTFGGSGTAAARGEFQKFATYFGMTADGSTTGLTPYLIKVPNAANFNGASNAGIGPDFNTPVNPVSDV